MKLTISCIYPEPDYSFKISHEVFNLIRDQLTNSIMTPFGLVEKDKKLFLGINISTDSQTKVVELRGPHYDRRNRFINYAIWLPYEDIVKSDKMLETFLTFLFDGLKQLFFKFNIKEGELNKVQSYVEKEILNNPKYIFNEEDIPFPDLSDII